MSYWLKVLTVVLSIVAVPTIPAVYYDWPALINRSFPCQNANCPEEQECITHSWECLQNLHLLASLPYLL